MERSETLIAPEEYLSVRGVRVNKVNPIDLQEKQIIKLISGRAALIFEVTRTGGSIHGLLSRFSEVPPLNDETGEYFTDIDVYKMPSYFVADFGAEEGVFFYNPVTSDLDNLEGYYSGPLEEIQIIDPD